MGSVAEAKSELVDDGFQVTVYEYMSIREVITDSFE